MITHTREEWKRIDLPPFRAAIAAGVDTIMTAHIVVPALDPSGDPATLSRPILTGLLRGELGYDGVIVTDALDMAGVRQKYGDDRVPVLALKAGADQLLMPPNLDVALQRGARRGRRGELTEAPHRRVGAPDPGAQAAARPARRGRRRRPGRRGAASSARRRTSRGAGRSPTARSRSSATTPGCCRCAGAGGRCSSPAGTRAPTTTRHARRRLAARGATRDRTRHRRCPSDATDRRGGRPRPPSTT